MKVRIGRLLQVAGMIVLPAGLIYGLTTGNVRHEVQVLALGGALFLAGRLMEKTAGS
jgi:hypothetical protein